MHAVMKSFLLLPLLVSAALSAHIDLSSYPLSVELRPNTYTLHWGFDVSAQTIRFAVNVSTTGWVGLGLSPTGGMANSDIVIGWVNDQGKAFFHDRFATGQALPAVDPSQDWTLEAGEQEDGFTTLAFRRDWVTCDSLDRNITTGTARVIYAWNDADPLNDNPDNVMQHDRPNRGTQSINLLGGLQEPPPEPADIMSFDVRVDNINVPDSDTTYWCDVTELPQAVRDQEHYVTRVSPVISPGNELYVHHILIYECFGLNNTHVGFSGPCNSGDEVGRMVSRCRRGTSTLLNGWAVGGGDFVYPADVAYPVGGASNPRYLVMETHYDNPDQISTIIDSSGMRFFYTSTPTIHTAGVLSVGHSVSQYMVIPPGANPFNHFGECSSDCTNQNIPAEGITVFANVLHTHLAGAGLTLHHLRPDPSCGNGYRELKPLDQNLEYDFNFQQINILPQAVQVLPGDILRLECNYNTGRRTGVSLGGESTSEEMCLSFVTYYPRIDLAACGTRLSPQVGAFQSFLIQTDFLTPQQQDDIATALMSGSRSQFEAALNEVSWSPQAIESLQSSIVNGPNVDFCVSQNTSFSVFPSGLQSPDPLCTYQPPNQCPRVRTPTTDPGVGGAPTIVASVFMVIIACLLGLL